MDSLTYTSFSQIFHANVHFHHPMDTLVDALVLYLLVIKSVIIVTVRSTTWPEIRVGLVKEMVPGQEVIHLVSMVGLSIKCFSYEITYMCVSFYYIQSTRLSMSLGSCQWLH